MSVNAQTSGHHSGIYTDTQAEMEPSTPDLQKAENLEKAEDLRARLTAQRKKADEQAALQRTNAGDAHSVAASMSSKADIKSENEHQLPPEDPFSTEALIAAGKAAAGLSARPMNAQQPQSVTTTAPKQSFQERTNDPAQQIIPEQPSSSIKSNDYYHADLELWLEITDYHNIKYRKAKLEQYVLEQQAARIASRLQKLKQGEAATIGRTGRRPSYHAPEIGIKRPRSPEAAQPRKVRPADSPNEPSRGRRLRSPSPISGPLEARITYLALAAAWPLRGPTIQIATETDPSLERRQQFYGPGRNARREHDLFEPARRGPVPVYENYGRDRYNRANDHEFHDDERFRDDRRGTKPDLTRGGKRGRR